MAFEHYIYTGAKRLRCGYTTGSCAALAAKAAAGLLLAGIKAERESILTPSGIRVEADILNLRHCESEKRCCDSDCACCAVKKDAGDDVDTTDGLDIYATVCKSETPGVHIRGGKGVGRVTKPGLEQPVGEAAINNTPREMIHSEVAAVCQKHGYTGGLEVIISVPGGKEAALKTFNPHMGIVDGISILGTTGIVEPRSLAALRDSIELEIRQQAALGEKRLVITLGNYGVDFVKNTPALGSLPTVSCANFIGDALDFAARYGYTHVLLAGHIGKLVKVAGGIMDTHSRVADCRTELFCAHAALAGANTSTARALMECATTDACIEILQREALDGPVLQTLAEAIGLHLERRVAGAYSVGAVVFNNRQGELCRTPGTDALLAGMEAKA